MDPPQLVLSNCIGGIDKPVDLEMSPAPAEAVNHAGLASPS